MRVTCTQENLARGLNMVAHLSDKNVNLPILNNVLLQARKGGLVLVSTNLEVGIKTKVRGKVEKEGEFTVAARLLTDFVNSLKKENIAIHQEEKSLVIKGQNHQTTIRGMEASEFPVIPDVEQKQTMTAPLVLFQEALSQTLFAASGDESRPELNSVMLQFEGTTCIMVATDSYRLAEKTINVNAQKKASQNVIVPARTLHELSRILEQQDAETLTIVINDNQVLFSCNDTDMVSRIISAPYPDYKQIIPHSFKNEIEFDAKEMTQAIKTTSLFCKQGINDVRLTLDKRFNDIAISAENSSFGKNVSNVPSLSADQEMDIVFNYKFLMDGLNRCTTENAILKTNDATSPAQLQGKGDTSYVYIIMPIKQ